MTQFQFLINSLLFHLNHYESFFPRCIDASEKDSEFKVIDVRRAHISSSRFVWVGKYNNYYLYLKITRTHYTMV